jgi:LmbE family N-acetylglucosaminyl deacetylase
MLRQKSTMSISPQRILAVGAHPDDVEFMCAGLLALLRAGGYEIHTATMTLGDCGSMNCKPEEIRRVRRTEAENACAALGASYHALDFYDFSIFNDDASNRRVTGLLREVNPSVVITHPPKDYLADHEVTSTLVRNACFYASTPNYDTSEWSGATSSSAIPHLYYAHPMEGVDIFGRPVVPQFFVDVSRVFPLKLEMLGCHESQRDWLRKHHGIDEYVDKMRRWSQSLAERATHLSGCAVEFAEAYRQHRGHAYPAGNILDQLLPGLIIPESRFLAETDTDQRVEP